MKLLLLFAANRVLVGLCPFTSKLGGVLSWIAILAEWVLIVLAFFFALHWWYGLIMAGLYLVIPMLLPRINPESLSDKAKLWSGIVSHASIVIVVLMYLVLFGVL